MRTNGPAEAGGRTEAGLPVPLPSGLPGFALARLPRILFGSGTSGELAGIVARYGRRALVVVRGPGFTETPDWARFRDAFDAAGVEVAVEAVEGEPSPALVDEIVARIRSTGSGPSAGSAPSAAVPAPSTGSALSTGSGRSTAVPAPSAASAAGPTSLPDVVVGIGGGSVLDTAKAVAGLLIPGNSVMDHLEGVGPQLPYRGPSVPFIAVPTTAGTGSEVTKNAVLSVHGDGAFKKSFRDDALIAAVAILDPDLLGSCPPDLISGNGMDAVTQLIESYVSLRANPITDALALAGLDAARDGLIEWYEEAVVGRGAGAQGSAAAVYRERMAYAALCSGICLANAGLGAVHGLASPLGAQFPIPHGAACGAVLAAATRVNIEALQSRMPESAALRRYADVGRVLANDQALTDPEARASLVDQLDKWRACLVVPWLSSFGIRESSIRAIVLDSRGSSMKTNPIVLTDDEIATIIRVSL